MTIDPRGHQLIDLINLVDPSINMIQPLCAVAGGLWEFGTHESDSVRTHGGHCDESPKSCSCTIDGLDSVAVAGILGAVNVLAHMLDSLGAPISATLVRVIAPVQH